MSETVDKSNKELEINVTDANTHLWAFEMDCPSMYIYVDK